MTSDRLTVRQVMQPEPRKVPPDCPVGDVLLLMNRERVGSVLVCAGERLLGIFTERDLLRRVSDAIIGWRTYPVRDWMTPNPHTIGADVGWEEAMQAMFRLGVRHLPVVDGDAVVGILSTRMLMSRRTEYLDARIEERTRELKRANDDLMARDLEVMHNLRAAGQLQKNLLPHAPPPWAEFDWATHYAPLDYLGGDYFDFAEPDAEHLGVLIADASGHSIAAAMVAVMTRYAFAEISRTSTSPGEVLTRLNSRLIGLMDSRFVSAFYGVVHRPTRRFRYASAGHPYPLHVQARTNSVKELTAQGFLLGIMPDEVYAEREVILEPGDRLVLFTDGLFEARNEIGEQFGTERMVERLQSLSLSAWDTIQDILECQRRFSNGVPPSDDVTVVAARLLG